MSSRNPMSFEELVRQAETLGPVERLKFLRDACGRDDDLYQRARDRVSASSPDWWDLEDQSDDDANEDFSADYIGRMIGPYRVTSTLGLGGMGEVVLAERADDQFNQRVAIKLVKRGLVSRQVRGRLKIERQILASLNHPNIAKLLDGGVTADGTPYIVMEYVEGEPIDSYCDRHRLSLRARLQMMLTVCSAVHAAHRNLVVHRDLKPSNILVTPEGVPKLLDFGIAKLLDGRESMHTVAETRADIRLMTPDHASPEQILGLPITTSSDIYVLGVLLYELLTGFRPFNLANKPFSFLERVICEQPPVAPSAAVAAARSTAARDEVASMAEARGTSVARWIRELRGDLDNIVLMAMRKEPERRYASVEQFATDIDLYLKGMPVIARTDRWTYRAAKFISRHTVAVGLAAALVVLLAGFAVTATIQSQRLEQERDAVAAQYDRAEAERERAESTASFLIEAFRVADPSEGRGNEITAREILDQGAKRIDSDLSALPATQAAMLNTIGRVYFNMGLWDQAEPLLERAIAVRGPLLGQHHPDVAESLVSLGKLRREQGRYDEAEQQFARALAIYQGSREAPRSQVAGVLHEQGLLYYLSGKLDDAERSLRQSLSVYQQSDASALVIAPVMFDLATLLQARSQFAASEQMFRAALQRVREELGENHPLYAARLLSVAGITQAQGRLDEAEKLIIESVTLLRRIYGDKHPETIDAMISLGTLQQEKKDYEAAEKSFRTALELDRELRGESHSYVGVDLMQLGSLAVAQGEYQEAEKLIRESLEVFRKSLPDNHPYVATGVANLGRTLLELHRLDEAETTLRQAIRLVTEAFGPDNENVAIAKISLARVLAQKHGSREAERLFRDGYVVLLESRGATAPRTVQARTWISEFYSELGRPEQAEQFFAASEGRDQGTAR